LGFGQVAAAAAAMCDPLLDGVPERFSVFHAHTYAFEPPSDAEILLTNDACVKPTVLDRRGRFSAIPRSRLNGLRPWPLQSAATTAACAQQQRPSLQATVSRRQSSSAMHTQLSRC
jgi:hypothetical protein